MKKIWDNYVWDRRGQKTTPEVEREERTDNMIKDYHLAWYKVGAIIIIFIWLFICVIFGITAICLNIFNLIVK